MEILKISSSSRPKSVAGAIAAVLRSSDGVELQAIGAGAVNQAVKSIAISVDYLKDDGISPVCVPSFEKISVEDEERTAIKFLVTANKK